MCTHTYIYMMYLYFSETHNFKIFKKNELAWGINGAPERSQSCIRTYIHTVVFTINCHGMMKNCHTTCFMPIIRCLQCFSIFLPKFKVLWHIQVGVMILGALRNTHNFKNFRNEFVQGIKGILKRSPSCISTFTYAKSSL